MMKSFQLTFIHLLFLLQIKSHSTPLVCQAVKMSHFIDEIVDFEVHLLNCIYYYFIRKFINSTDMSSTELKKRKETNEFATNVCSAASVYNFTMTKTCVCSIDIDMHIENVISIKRNKAIKMPAVNDFRNTIVFGI